MDTSINNAKAFTDAIKKTAKEECDRINKETNEIRTQRLASFNEEAQNRYESYVSYETARILQQKNKKISALEEQSKRTLSALRAELCGKVFDKVKEDIKSFTETEDYKDLLIFYVREIYESNKDGELEFFVRKEDMLYKEFINDHIGKFIHISESSDIILGGVKAVNRNTGCLFDNTLDMKLEEQKTWFLENSGLKI